MHQELIDPIVARFTFAPDRAAEFIEQEGQLVTQLEFDSIDEVMECVEQFSDAITDAFAFINGRVVDLADYKEA